MPLYECQATDGQARAGRLLLPHGVVETPIFMPVGTYGVIKGLSPSMLERLGAQIVLGNTFHLWLRPGLEVMAAHGGLHRFMNWQRPILTDSGGFQVWSLGELRKISEEGVTFQSPINGDRLFLSPEESMRIQGVLNSDIAMVLMNAPLTLPPETKRPRAWNSPCVGPSAASERSLGSGMRTGRGVGRSASATPSLASCRAA